MEKKIDVAVERNIPKEINESYREDLALMQQNKERRTKRHTMFNNGPKGVSVKVKHLDPDEIREEYGMTLCPYPTMAENVIAVFMEERCGRNDFLTLNQIAMKLGKTVKNTSSHLSHVYLAFISVEENIIERRMIVGERGKRQYGYRLTVDESYTLPMLKTIYLEGMQERAASRKLLQEEKVKSEKIKEMEQTEETFGLPEDLHLDMGSLVSELIEKLIQKGLDIRVTVEFKFPR